MSFREKYREQRRECAEQYRPTERWIDNHLTEIAWGVVIFLVIINDIWIGYKLFGPPNKSSDALMLSLIPGINVILFWGSVVIFGAIAAIFSIIGICQLFEWCYKELPPTLCAFFKTIKKDCPIRPPKVD